MNALEEYKTLEEKNEFFASNITIESKEDLDLQIENLGNNPNLIFRGLSEARYKLYTSGQRAWLTNEEIRKESNKVYTDFIASIIEKAKEKEAINKFYLSLGVILNDILYLSFLQHYGAPTPFLDFSYNHKVSLYFAINNNTETKKKGQGIDDYFSLYYIDLKDKNTELVSGIEMLDKAIELAKKSLSDCEDEEIDTSIIEEINKLTAYKTPEYGSDGFDKMPMAFYDHPSREKKLISYRKKQVLYFANPNLIAQDGCFIMNNSEDMPLAEYFMFKRRETGIKLDRKIHCINIHKSLASYLKDNYLKGIDESTLFPTFKSAAEEINKELGLK